MEMLCAHLRNSRTEDNIITTYSRKPRKENDDDDDDDDWDLRVQEKRII